MSERHAPVRIAHITTIDLSLRYLLLDLLVRLRDSGYDVTGISSPGPDVSTLEARGIRHLAVAMTRKISPLHDARALVHLVRTLRREKFTIVHTHTPKAGVLGRIAARLANTPIVVHTSHGFLFHDRSHWLWRWFVVLVERVAARCSDRMFSVSKEDLATAINERICGADDIAVLGTGIDLEHLNRERVTPASLDARRAELGLAPGERIVGFVGRLVREKGILELLEAGRLVRERIPCVRLLIIGPVDHTKGDAVRPECAREYGMEHTAVFAGMRQDLPELYALMDVFVLPSHREGLPRAPMEASAMGVPCVVTDVRGCREVVVHGRNGFIVPLGDAAALADAIVRILEDAPLAGRMARDARQMAVERFDERSVATRLGAEYSRLLSAKGIAAPTAARPLPKPAC